VCASLPTLDVGAVLFLACDVLNPLFCDGAPVAEWWDRTDVFPAWICFTVETDGDGLALAPLTGDDGATLRSIPGFTREGHVDPVSEIAPILFALLPALRVRPARRLTLRPSLRADLDRFGGDLFGADLIRSMVS